MKKPLQKFLQVRLGRSVARTARAWFERVHLSVIGVVLKAACVKLQRMPSKAYRLNALYKQ